MNDHALATTVQQYVRSGVGQDFISNTLRNNSEEFISLLLSVVNGSTALQSCEPLSVIQAGMTAFSMGLSFEPGLGMASIIPYNNKKKIDGRDVWVMEAQFQIGAKGFKQLALRTGKYKFINVDNVRQGEYKGMDRLTGEHEFKFIKNEKTRRKKKIVGYFSYFEEHSGYSKTFYMTVPELFQHAKKYSKQFKKGGGKWADLSGDGFDYMAQKTVLKLNLSKNGQLTTKELRTAIRADQASVDGDEYNYIDNDKSELKGEPEQAKDRKETTENDA